MPSPYRRAPTRAPVATERSAGARWDDVILGALMLVLAGPRVVLAVAEHETFGAEITIATIAVGLGLLLLLVRPRS